MDFSFGCGTQNVNRVLCNSTNTLVEVCFDWASSEMLFESGLQMSACFSNIAHFTVWTFYFVHKSASQKFVHRFFQRWQHSFQFSQCKDHFTLNSSNSIRSAQSSDVFRVGLAAFSPILEKYQEWFLSIFIFVFISQILWKYVS